MKERMEFDQTEVLLRCKIKKGWFSGERICSFKIGDKEWDTCQSAWMCYNSDFKVAADLPEDTEYDGWAEVVRVVINGEDGKGYVRYWFAHDTEGMSDLDSEALRAAIIQRPPHTVRGTLPRRGIVGEA